MTAIKLPGQLELPTVIDHKKASEIEPSNINPWKDPNDARLAKLLIDYENRPTSETWSRIQALSAEILK